MLGGATETTTETTTDTNHATSAAALGQLTVDALLARCEVNALDELDDASLARLAAEVVGLWSRLEAARLRLIGAVEARQAFKVDGARDTATWLAWKAGERRGSARREVELAVAVAAMPAVDAALAAATLTRAKAVELARVAHASAEDQATLVDEAKTLPVETVARHIDRWELEHARAVSTLVEGFTVTPVPGGGRVEATLDVEGLEWVRVAVDHAAEQLGMAHVGWNRRQAKGLVAVCRYFLDHAQAPAQRGGRPTVVVTVDVETLAAASGGSARLDSGAYVRGDLARRLACDAGLTRLITDPQSMPLDVGRRTRTISPAQARGVIHRDRHCRFEGCTAPPWACEVHHGAFWARDRGRTDVDQLFLLCWHHHSLTHRCSSSHDLSDRGDGRLQLRRRRRTEHSDAA